MVKLAPGDVFAGKFVVQRELGEGGFATVYLAHLDGSPIALKVITQQSGGYEPDVVARTTREAEVLRQLQSPTTVRLLDAGTSPDGQLYLAFEYVPGVDLVDLLAERGRLETGEVEHILRQLLHALDEAHRKGLIHRDIKPQNIRVRSDAGPLEVKLLDFGIARPTEDGASNVTKTGEIVGTLRYMAPEQLMSMPTTTASDIYSLGLVGFELLMGSESLHGSKLGDQFERLKTGHVFAVPDDAGGISAVLARMTARDPKLRYGSCRAVLEALAPAPRASKESTPAPAVPAPTANIAGIAGLLIAAVATAGLIVWGLATPDETPPERATRARTAILRSQAKELPVAQVDAGPRLIDVDVRADLVAYVPRPSAGCGLTAEQSGLGALDLVAMVPPGYDADRPYPLVLVLHDDGVSVRDLVGEGGLDAARKAVDVVIAVPEHRGSRQRIVQARDAVLREACIDERRVYIIAHGAGGHAANAVRCDDWVTGMGYFGTALRPEKRFRLPRCTPPPTIWLEPEVVCPEPANTPAASTREALRTAHLCSEPDDWASTAARCESWTCERPLVVCKTGGGTLWPGLQAESSVGECAATSTTVPVFSEIWRFLESVPQL